MLLKQISKTFKERREKLTQKNPGAIFLLPAALELIRNHDVHHAYRQDSSFYYLTGFDEAESFLVLSKGKMVLFVQKRDPLNELWTGEKYGFERAKSIFGADEVYDIVDLEKKLPDFLSDATHVCYRLGQSHDALVLGAMEKVRKKMGRTGRGLLPIYDPLEIIGESRIIKDKEEIEFQKKACELTALGHLELMKFVRPGMKEYEPEAHFEYFTKMRGCKRMGYGTISAAGANATCLHYTANNDVMKEGDLYLVDAGSEYEFFSADITRTYPIGKTFSGAQKTVYELVLKAQKAALELARPGNSMRMLHQKACEVITQGLIDMGLIKENLQAALEQKKYFKYYPHLTGHYLGMDVHDAGLYLKNNEGRPFEPGMVFTVEPGLYFQPSESDYPNAFKGIGIRIEDDVLITQNGCEIMTSKAPKEITEIENIRS